MTGSYWPDPSRSLALADLEEIGDHVALNNPMRALSFVRECRKMLDNSLAFRALEDLTPGLRVLPYDHYLIFYAHGHHRADRANLQCT